MDKSGAAKAQKDPRPTGAAGLQCALREEIGLSVDHTKASIGLPVDAVFKVPARAEKMTPRGFEPRLQA